MIIDPYFKKQIIKGFELTTAEIIYHLPDTPHLLQSYLWQDYDLCPKFPILKHFLDFWQRELDGPLHSVTVTTSGKLISAPDLPHICTEVTLH